ncbi:MAG: HDOD domain-containing protein [Phycisphaerales bacterium JB059]
MSKEVLSQILDCPSLPSLPSVAVQLLDLTKDPDAKVSDISVLVQQDQGLAAKVLKTVNSSFYGLSKPCGSIERALMYLGLNTVKSLVLGFSLVETTGTVGDDAEFDLNAHWQSSIHGAVAARELALRTLAAERDDAFTAGLFQNVGMLAMNVAIEAEYADVLRESGPRRDNLCLVEKQRLGIDHAEAGAALVEKWNLPADIAFAVRMHHDGDRAVGREASLARVVALGNLAAEAMAGSGSAIRAREFGDKLYAWFKITTDVEALLEGLAADAKTLAKLFNVEMGETANVRRLMSEASDRAIEIQLQAQRQAQEMTERATTDALTGIHNRSEFDKRLEEAFAAVGRDGTPMGVIFLDADRFKSVNDTHGHAAGDAVLVELARRVREAVGSEGVACRYGGEEFAVILPGLGVERGAEIGERIRASVEATPFDLRDVEDTPDELPVTVSVGVSATDAADPARVRSADKLVLEADEAVYAAKKSGRNRVKVFGRLREIDSVAAGSGEARGAGGEKASAGPVDGAAPLILLCEDDALAATLLKTILGKGGRARVDWVSTGTRAAARLRSVAEGSSPAPDLIVADLGLPGSKGVDLLRIARGTEALRETPFVIMTASMEAEDQIECTEAGATAFIRKVDLCSELPKWVDKLLATARNPSNAAA